MKVPEGLTAEQVQPQPLAWPQCADCKTPFVLRRALSFGTGEYTWAWMRDCKHDKRKKQPETVIAGPDGVFDPPEATE